jgi:two-component system, cell cycle sensor histidine kinase and response regulator CckA
MTSESGKRADELAHSLSLLRATLEATSDGILVVDGRGRVTSFNETFADMCRFPREVMASDAESGMLELVLLQLKDPEPFLAKVKELYANPEAESFDIVEFRDGRTFERYSKPQRVEERVVGRVWSFRDVTDRKRAEADLRFKTALLEAQVSCSNDGLLVVDGKGKKILQNQRMIDLWKIPQEIADDADDESQVRYVTGRTKNPQQFIDKVVYLYSHPEETSHDEIEAVDGTMLDRYSYPIVGGDGTYYGRIWSFRDITERRHLEDQLRQAQKMEAVGRLAGGIAHDFNNILGIIRGQAEFLAREVSASGAAPRRLEQIGQATDRAANLTRQLLAFGRKQVLQPRRLDLNVVVSEIEPMLRSLLGESVQVVVAEASDPVVVRADAGQIEYVIMSLAMNSRDAMPKGGRLVLRTANVELAAEQTSHHPDVAAGPYAMLAVEDTGAGMDAQTRSHVFEPFFTTKPMGQGTGLGLAAIHGIVSQSQGHIEVESVPGQGTTFRIYLPRLEMEPVAPGPAVSVAGDRDSSETILLVEDEPSLKELNSEVLRELGYEVLAAGSGGEALKIAAAREGRIDLLLADVVMPGQSGTELARLFLATRPGTKVLYMSGYAGDDLVQYGLDEAVAGFIEKPFSPSALAKKVREVLES